LEKKGFWIKKLYDKFFRAKLLTGQIFYFRKKALTNYLICS